MGRDCVPRTAVSRIATVAMAVIMITSVFGGVAAADTGVEPAPPADEVFVDDDGSGVLVYDEDGLDDEGSAEIGLDVSESVAYALVTEEIEDDISAAFSMALDNDGFESSGDLTAEQPPEINDLSMDVSGEQSDSTNEFDASLDMSIVDDSPPNAAGEQSASTSGQVVTGADELATHGEFSVTDPATATGPETAFDMEISESAGSFTLDIAQQNQVSSFELDDWETEADAQATLEDEFGVVAQDLGGDVSVTIHDHQFEEDATAMGDGHLDIEYTIELENVTDGVEQAVANDLATDPALDVSQQDAEQIAADIVDADLETFKLSVGEEGDTLAGEWDVAISGFESSALAMFELAEQTGEMDDNVAEEFDDYEEMYEAQAAADLTETVEWDATLDQVDDTEITLEADLSSETDNWDDYTDELADRDIDTPEFTINANAETVGDEIEFEMDLEVGQEELIETAVTGIVEDLQNDPMVDDEALDLVSAFDEADLELVKFDLDMDAGTATMEAGAAFDDLSAFEDHLEDAYDGATVEHIYGDEDASYVYLTDLADDDDTADDIRQNAAVGSHTEVHMPGDWDEDHPRLDMEDVNDYLETDDGEDDDGDDSIPGFGAVAALVALLSIALWARTQ